MKWLLGTYTGRFNRPPRLFGHLFSGRYKSLVIDERGGDYLRTAYDYVHLNPCRMGLGRGRRAVVGVCLEQLPALSNAAAATELAARGPGVRRARPGDG